MLLQAQIPLPVHASTWVALGHIFGLSLVGSKRCLSIPTMSLTSMPVPNYFVILDESSCC